MKKKPFINLSIRLRFIFMIMLELVCVSLISWLVMDVLHISAVPNIVWIILASVTAGGVLNNFLSIRYFGPVLKLKKAMQQVAEGDFSVRLETEKQMKEIRDIYSNFNLMVQELEATEILQTDFVSNVSHEFKTPISAIEGYATLLQDDDMPISEEQEQYISKILFNTRRLSHLAGNILLLSKIEHQSIQTRQNWYRLDEQIRQSIVMMEPKWSEKEIEFEQRDIKEEKPTAEELKTWWRKSGLPLKRFFNTSGKLYKEMQLKDRIPNMSEDEQIELLASDGMLVKRPILVQNEKVLVGFKEKEWQEIL